MRVSVEFLYHFSCSVCGNWWTVGDLEWSVGKEITCPHCRHTEVIPDALLRVDDGTRNLFEDVERARRAFKVWRQQRRKTGKGGPATH